MNKVAKLGLEAMLAVGLLGRVAMAQNKPVLPPEKQGYEQVIKDPYRLGLHYRQERRELQQEHRKSMQEYRQKMHDLRIKRNSEFGSIMYHKRQFQRFKHYHLRMQEEIRKSVQRQRYHMMQKSAIENLMSHHHQRYHRNKSHHHRWLDRNGNGINDMFQWHHRQQYQKKHQNNPKMSDDMIPKGNKNQGRDLEKRNFPFHKGRR